MSRGFMFSGMGFLLAIPAVIIVGSLLVMMETGDEATGVAVSSDVVYYTANNVKSHFEETAGRLVCTYTTNYTGIRNYLVNNWTTYIEGEYSYSRGVNISIDEEYLNASYNSSSDSIQIYNGTNTSQGIRMVVNNTWGTVMETSLGSLNLSVVCNVNPVVNITYPYPPNKTCNCSMPWTNGTAWDPDGVVLDVRVNRNGTSYPDYGDYVSANGTSDWNRTWSPRRNGSYTISAYAVDNEYARSVTKYRNATVEGCPCVIRYTGGTTVYKYNGMGHGKHGNKYAFVNFTIRNDDIVDLNVTNLTVEWNKTSGVEVFLVGVFFNGLDVWNSGGATNVGTPVTVPINNGDGYVIPPGGIVTVKLEFTCLEGMGMSCGMGMNNMNDPDMRNVLFNTTYYMDDGFSCSPGEFRTPP